MSVRIGMCDWSFPITGIGGIRFASELGIKSYQLTLGPRARGYPLTEQELQKKYLECGEKYGVEFVSINADDLMSFPLSYPAGSYENDEARRFVKICINTAYSMGIDKVMTSCVRKGIIKTEEDLLNTADSLKDICDYAAPLGIKVTNENYLDSAGNLLLASMVSRENFTVFYDSQNPACFADHDASEMVFGLKDHILKLGQVHVKDGFKNRPGSVSLGEGDSNFYKSMENLKAIGFHGDILIENFYTESKFGMNKFDDIFGLVSKDINTLKQIFNV